MLVGPLLAPNRACNADRKYPKSVKKLDTSYPAALGSHNLVVRLIYYCTFGGSARELNHDSEETAKTFVEPF